jgi:hypothetical protein
MRAASPPRTATRPSAAVQMPPCVAALAVRSPTLTRPICKFPYESHRTDFRHLNLGSFGWSCCSAATGLCCSDDYGQCCGGTCCEAGRTCCGGNCCNMGYTCGRSGRNCVRETTAVSTVTSTTSVRLEGTNAAVMKRAREGLGAAGVVLAAAGFL